MSAGACSSQVSERPAEGSLRLRVKRPDVSKDKILGVDDLIGRYRSGGKTDSSGSFTLDPKKALERLAQFSLPDPYKWILKVVQGLHRSGAREIQIDGGVNKVTVLADAAPAGFDNMDDLLTQLIADAEQANPSLRHLAAGLQGSLAVSPNRIRLRLTHQGEIREYVLKSGGWRESEPKPTADKTDRFELELNRNLSEKLGHSWFLLNADIFDLMFGRKAALDKENKQVDGFCKYSACNFLLGGRSCNDRAFGAPRFKGYNIRSDANPGEARPRGLGFFKSEELVDGVCSPFHHLVEEVVPSREPGGFRLSSTSHTTVTNLDDPGIFTEYSHNGLARACAIRMDLGSLSNVLFWEDGVLIGRETLDNLNCPGFLAIVNARELGKDLTTIQVRKDTVQYRELIEELRATGERLRLKVKENLHLMPPSDRIQQSLDL